MKYCTKCGAPISENAKFCNRCGNPINSSNIKEKVNTDVMGESKNEEHEGKIQDFDNIQRDKNNLGENPDNKEYKESNADEKSYESQHKESSINAESNNDEYKEDAANKNYNRSEENSAEKSLDSQNDKQNAEYNSFDDNVKDRTDEIDNTMKINMDSETIRNAQNEWNNRKHYDNENDNRGRRKSSSKKNKSIFSGAAPKVIIGIIVVMAILCGVFFNKISSRYYMMKSNDAVNIQEKIDYAAKAVKADNNNDTMELLKNSIIELSKSNLDLAEEKLKELSNILTQSDIKNISIAIKEKKVETLCSSSNYEDALNEFDELDKLGVDFKKNKHYDDVMINVISKLTGCQARGNKNALMEDEAIYYDNLDDDVFDEVIEVKEGRKYDNYLKVNLYKFNDGKYKLVDSKTINTAENKGIQGVYEYEEGHKGVFISYESTVGRTFGTSVYGVDDSRLVLKGVVYGNNYTKPDDTNNDGIYEVVSSSKSNISSSRKEVVKAYSIHDDGRTPSEVSDNNSASSETSSSDYILPNSDKAYLTEEDVRDLGKDKLALARNEIFARHGYIFKEEPYKSYFESKSWYSKNPNFDGSDSGLNDYEIANYKVIQNWEKR